MECYHTVYTEGTGEIVEKKSRFIAEVFPVSNEEEAFAHLEEIRKKHWDARHHCWAYVIGRNPAAERTASPSKNPHRKGDGKEVLQSRETAKRNQ